MTRPLAPMLTILVVALVLVSGFGQGGEALWGQGLVAIAGAVGWSAMALWPRRPWPAALRGAGLAWGLVILWTVIQALPLGIAAHPSWFGVASLLGMPAAGSIAVDPQASFDAAIRLAAYAGVFALAVQAAPSSTLLLSAIAVAVAAVASLGLAVDSQTVGPAGLMKVRHWGDAAFPFANRNHYSVFAGIGALAALGQLVTAPSYRGWRTVIWLSVLLVCLGAAFASHSRAGLAALAVASAAMIVYLNPRRRVWLPVVLAGLALAGILTAGTLARLETLDEALALRGSIIAAAAGLATQYPWTGVGSFDLAFQAIAPAWNEGMVQSAHNILIESLAERGWPSTLAAIVAIGLVLGQCARSIALSGNGKVAGATAIGVATLVLLHGMVDFSVYAPTIAALVAIVLGLGAGQALAPAPAPPIGLARGNPFEGARA